MCFPLFGHKLHNRMPGRALVLINARQVTTSLLTPLRKLFLSKAFLRSMLVPQTVVIRIYTRNLFGPSTTSLDAIQIVLGENFRFNIWETKLKSRCLGPESVNVIWVIL